MDVIRKENDVDTSEGVDITQGSKWYRPELKSLQEYRKYVSKNLDIKELQDKTLICRCDFWKKCHGHILVYLSMLDANVMIKEFTFKETEKSPLSNSYPFSFRYEGHTFSSISHAYHWERSKRSNALLNHKNIEDVYEAFHLCNDRAHLSVKKTIRLLYCLLVEKYKRCPEFKALVDENNDNLIQQDNKNGFWSKGSHDYQDEMKNQGSQNVGGWLIMFLKVGDINVHRKKIIYLCKGEVSEGLMRGLKLVHRCLKT